jgi:hypothetical protein
MLFKLAYILMFLSMILLILIFKIPPVNVFNIPEDFTRDILAIILLDSVPTIVFLTGVAILVFAQLKQWSEDTEED